MEPEQEPKGGENKKPEVPFDTVDGALNEHGQYKVTVKFGRTPKLNKAIQKYGKEKVQLRYLDNFKPGLEALVFEVPGKDPWECRAIAPGSKIVTVVMRKNCLPGETDWVLHLLGLRYPDYVATVVQHDVAIPFEQYMCHLAENGGWGLPLWPW